MEPAALSVVTIPNVVQLMESAALLVAVIAGGFTLVGALAVWRADRSGASAFFRMFERMQVQQLLTVMLVIASATLLALLGMLNSNGITGILSGVAGYVLGGLSRTQAPAAAPSDKPVRPATKGSGKGGGSGT